MLERTRTYACIHMHPRTRARAHTQYTHTHARARAHTHTHTHTHSFLNAHTRTRAHALSLPPPSLSLSLKWITQPVNPRNAQSPPQSAFTDQPCETTTRPPIKQPFRQKGKAVQSLFMDADAHLRVKKDLPFQTYSREDNSLQNNITPAFVKKKKKGPSIGKTMLLYLTPPTYDTKGTWL